MIYIFFNIICKICIFLVKYGIYFLFYFYLLHMHFPFSTFPTYPIKHRLTAVYYKFMFLIYMLPYLIHKITLHMKQLPAFTALKMIMLHTPASVRCILVAGTYSILYSKFPHHIILHQPVKISVNSSLSNRCTMNSEVIYYHICRNMYILVFYHVIKYHFPLFRFILCHISSIQKSVSRADTFFSIKNHFM